MSNSTPRPQAEDRSAYRQFMALGTRWMDNDAYGHVNNVVYYSLFDTAVNSLLIDAGLLKQVSVEFDLHEDGTVTTTGSPCT